jgi:hypothetical protein
MQNNVQDLSSIKFSYNMRYNIVSIYDTLILSLFLN